MNTRKVGSKSAQRASIATSDHRHRRRAHGPRLTFARPNEQFKSELAEISELFVCVLRLLGFTSSQIADDIARATRREQPAALRPVAAHLGYIARVLARWAEDPRFANEQGTPRDLPVRGGKLSFSRLVAEELPGESADSCLNILLTIGAVSRLPSGLVRWRSRAAISNRNRADTIFVDEYIRPLRALLLNLQINLTREAPIATNSTFLRSVGGFEVPVSDLGDLRRLLETQGMILIETVDNWLKQRVNQHASNHDEMARLVRPYVGLLMTGDGDLPT